MWDTKRQIIWLAAAILVGTFFLYPLGYDEAGRFDPVYFAMLEMILLIIIVVLFYVYSKRG